MIDGALKADGRLAAKNAVKIRAALHQVTDFKKVFDKYQETQPQPTDNPTQDRTRARSWLILNVYLNDEPLRQTVMRAWAEAYVLGQAAADEWIKKTKEANKADDIEVNWDNWKPGDKATALLLNPTKGFEAYLQSVNADSYFKKFNKETIVNLGTALSDSITTGLDAESAAVMIGRHVASPSRALTIAITEQNRAMSFGSIQRYKEAGLQKMEWAVSDPCDICAKNDGQVIVIGQTFASGDAQPPAHPHCRCVLLPVIPGMEDEPEIPGVTMVTPPSPVNFGPDATTFRTPKEEIEQVVAALQEGRSLNEALDMYEALDARPYVPGQWEILPQVLNRQAAISALGRALVYPMPREQIERTFFASNTIKKADRAFIEKAVIYKNGPLEVQFSSTGLTVTEAERKMVIKEVEKLQATNPKTRAVVHIDKNASGKFGWAYGGKQDLWVTPRTIKQPDLEASAKGGFKMPVTAATTQFEYTLAHEWGHLIDDITNGVQDAQRTNAIRRLKAEFPNAFKSGYSGENSKEFFAEMFTEYYRTNGQTPNLLVQAMAKEFGWKVPDVPKPQIDYVAARKPAAYFTPQKALELEEGIPWRPEGENLYLKKILDEQGFNGKPRVVSATEYKKALDSGALPLHRGVAGDTAEQVDQFVGQLLTGDTPYIGRGLFGDGTYFADSPATALKFAKEDRVGNPIPFGKTVEAALDPRAKIAYLEDIEAEFQRTGLMTPAQKELYYSYPQDFYESASMWATANGYDAIRIKNPVVNWTTREQVPDTYTIVLNRTALIIKEMP
jgi:SPP1 gp7 family putative phage head morphogenesis protein